MADQDQPDLATLTVQLLSAYVANNTVASEDLAGLIQSTRHALSGEAGNAAGREEAPAPAVSVRKSLASRDHILSLIDGKPYKSLKRHLASHGLSPDEYRDRYNLARDYPMVAPSYSEHRRAVAARFGLGRKRPAKSAPAEENGATEKATTGKGAATSGAGRPRKAATKATAEKGRKAAGRTPAKRKAPARQQETDRPVSE